MIVQVQFVYQYRFVFDYKFDLDEEKKTELNYLDSSFCFYLMHSLMIQHFLYPNNHKYQIEKLKDCPK